MRFEQIRFFVEIAEAGSISQAAANLHISQPSVSVAISDLEHELGCKLFNRTKAGSVLRDEARPLLEEAVRLLASIENIYSLSKTSRKDAAILRLSHVPSISPRYISNIFLSFNKNFPSLQLEMHAKGSNHTIRDLLEWNEDIGIITAYEMPGIYRKPEEDASYPLVFLDDKHFRKQIYFSELYSTRLGICMSSARAKRFGGSCSLKDLDDEAFLAISTNRKDLLTYLSPHYPVLDASNVTMRIRDYETMMLLCKRDVGISMINKTLFDAEQPKFGDSLRFIEIEDEMPSVHYGAVALQSNMYKRTINNCFYALHDIFDGIRE